MKKYFMGRLTAVEEGHKLLWLNKVYKLQQK